MAQLDPPSATKPSSPLIYVGAAGLIVIIVVETLAVIGRHIGWPLLGAIEIIQACILVCACVAVVLATINNVHATVHLITDRLGVRPKRLLAQLAALLSTLFFSGLAAGAVWLASDFWRADEESELLHLPIKPLRILTCIAVIIAAGLFIYRMWSPTSMERKR